MLHDDDDIDTLQIRSATQYHLPAYESIVSDPAKGLIPIATVIVLSFLGVRWLMKS
jgi:hypothetical protein